MVFGIHKHVGKDLNKALNLFVFLVPSRLLDWQGSARLQHILTLSYGNAQANI